jgi:formate dehydrogenase major subunit
VPGLGASFGRGAATNFQQDLANSDCILIMGSNMAEAHPVGFRWAMKARERGATLIHVDPRFSRTSASCNTYVQIRSGTDIAFLGGMINYVLTKDKWFKEFVLAYTNATTIIDEKFGDTEDLDGIFSGYDPETRQYNSGKGHWVYKDSPASLAHANDGTGPHLEPRHDSGPGSSFGAPDTNSAAHGVHGHSLQGGASTHGTKRSDATTATPQKDPTLQHPFCVMNILKRHFARYTPDVVSRMCGCTEEEFVRIAETLIANSGRERTSAIVYAVGWTQHSIGPQIIRAATILQQLLGNIGRPGGMIMAMRGHCSIQGSTDVPTLYDLLPGYLPQPIAEEHHNTLDGYADYEGFPTGYWAKIKPMMVSLLKAYYGGAATAENEYRFKWLPHIDGDYSQLPFFETMTKGEVKGYFVFGQNPAAGAPNAKLHRAGLRQLDWLVVADWFETDTAMFWKDDPSAPPSSEIKTEVFLLPAASIAAKEGSFTNTQRLLQWHDKAVDPDGDSRSDLWFVWNLGRRLKELYRGSTRPQDQAIQALTWDYASDERLQLPDGSYSTIADEPDAKKVLQEINGFHTCEKDAKIGKPKLLSGFSELKDDGSTACGVWIYSGVYPSYDRNRARDRQLGDNPLQPEWAYAWPHNRRTMYNRASADPHGKPWSERKKLIWWDDEQKKWAGFDEPDFEPEKPPDYRPPPGAKGMDAIAGDQPFILKPDGVSWLFAPAMKDGPLPAHYEAVESPFSNLIYPKQDDNPTVRYFEGPLNPLDHTPSKKFRCIGFTYRVTEHYLSGPMSRFNSWLNELMPAMFVEISEELAAERGIKNAEWVIVSSARSSIEARALVTRRLRPLQINGAIVHQIGIPFHWGFAGETVGGIANDLIGLTADSNVSIQESKTFACEIAPGRLNAVDPVPTALPARWPTKESVPDTPRSAQPEGQIHRDSGAYG